MDFDSVTSSRSSASDKRRRQLKLKKQREAKLAAIALEKEKELAVIQERAREERRREKLYNDTVQKYYAEFKNPYKAETLRPYAIKGDGDKIVLPESWLNVVGDGVGVVTFRIGVEREGWDSLKGGEGWRDFDWETVPNPSDLSGSFCSDDMNDDSDNDNDDTPLTAPILRHSLGGRWERYTHAGVLSFTANEGDVGITESMARRLGGGEIRMKGDGGEIVDEETRRRRVYDDEWTEMEDRDSKATFYLNRRTGERTLTKPDFNSKLYAGVTGNVGVDAWGSFGTPTNVTVEVIKLRKGEWCELTPDLDSVRKGFYKLENVKIVLEESISASRTTLSCGDVISTPWRGKEYTLKVTKLKPDFEGKGFGGICVINSDLEVEFGRDPEVDKALGGTTEGGDVIPMDDLASPNEKVGGGVVLGSSSASETSAPPASHSYPLHPLPPLPPDSSSVKVALRGHYAEVLEVSPDTTYQDVVMYVQGKTGKAVRLGRIENLADNVIGGVIYCNFVS